MAGWLKSLLHTPEDLNLMLRANLEMAMLIIPEMAR